MAAISSQKNAKIDSIAWQYTDLEKTKQNLIENGVKLAKNAARTIAHSLSVPLIGVHKLSYNLMGLDNDFYATPISAYAGTKRNMKTPALENLHLSHITTLKAIVNAKFIVAKFEQSEVHDD